MANPVEENKTKLRQWVIAMRAVRDAQALIESLETQLAAAKDTLKAAEHEAENVRLALVKDIASQA